MTTLSPVKTNEFKKLRSTVHRYIRSCQRDDGAILWFKDGKLDPWDHTEAAMGLTIAGDFDAAKKAFLWLKENQNADGSWFAKYYSDEQDNDNDRKKIETNFVAYPACGLWHYFLVTEDKAFCDALFPTIEKAINFVLKHQGREGEILWATSSVEPLPKDALVTASASILRSIECAILLADALNISHDWQNAYMQLAHALKNKPWRFDRTWEPKTRFSMDWFYPILSGIYTEQEARARLHARKYEFIQPSYGCRCVSDQPWVTIAESCELTLALIASHQQKEAEEMFRKLLRWQDRDGGFWTGFQFKEQVIWPKEKTTWTAAAVLLAADALYNHTKASQIFTQPSHLYFT